MRTNGGRGLFQSGKNEHILNLRTGQFHILEYRFEGRIVLFFLDGKDSLAGHPLVMGKLHLGQVIRRHVDPFPVLHRYSPGNCPLIV